MTNDKIYANIALMITKLDDMIGKEKNVARKYDLLAIRDHCKYADKCFREEHVALGVMHLEAAKDKLKEVSA